MTEQPLWREFLWTYTGFGKPPHEPEIHFSWQAKAAAALVGVGWTFVTAAGIVYGCLVLGLRAVPELVMPCPVGWVGCILLLLIGSPLVGIPRIGLEMTKAAGSGVWAARLCVIAASTVWWTVFGFLMLYPTFYPRIRLL